jgi:SAM-dependent methyltransferase
MNGVYQGGELALFARAHNWKRYIAAMLSPFVAGRVLEVGSGLGTNIALFTNPNVTAWHGVEPDPELAEQARIALARSSHGGSGGIVTGTLDAIGEGEYFDSILYIDVLEHIEDDRRELARAAAHLIPGGQLTVLAPAHQFLYSAFDRAIGHYRRYNLETLTALRPPGCVVRRSMMLDAAGLLASLGNRFVYERSMPTEGQIAFWDRVLVPVSRILDPCLLHRLGKTAVVIWRKC